MAMIAVQVVLEKLASFVAEETRFLGGVSGGIVELQDDLYSMKSFLQDAEERSESDQGLRAWVKQVRDVAYDAENILEEFMLRFAPSHESGFIHYLRNSYRSIRKLSARHRLAVHLESIKARLKAIYMPSTSSATVEKWHDPRLAALYLDEADVVGIENPKHLLVSWLVEGEENLSSISVVGMGGLGKTTLVKKVYDSHRIRRSFDTHLGRIIFTTRLSNLAESIENTSHVYELQALAENEAWILFCMKAFRGEHKAVCPPELEEMSRNILKKCEGLPLAIVAIGGLLSKRKNGGLEWKKVHDCLATELKSNDDLGSLRRILQLSYDNLPYYLKQCYLYLSVFPEDYLIKRRKLIRLWIVERFVEEKQGFTMEEVAEEYLNELVNRILIQVVEMNYFNRVKTYRAPLSSFLPELVELFHLRYLSLRWTMIMSFQKSIRKLKYLEILDLKGSPVSSLPSGITQLTCLCQLRIGRLTSLQKLGSVEVNEDYELVRELGKLTQLRRLGILKLREEQGIDLCYTLDSGFSKLKRLGLHELERLRRIRIAKGSMPGLERLDITACTVLETVPDGIENLKNIGDLVLWYMPSTFIKTIERYRGEDFWRVQHITTITRIYQRLGRWVSETLL
uniref:Disease resistance protein RPM1-like n=1 Tax=Populus trichocarpa TaxID=3694 RepID=A0A2K2A9Z1_POPTR